MNKKKIQALALKSYTGKTLDSKKVKLVASMLTRKDLKKFISQLKNEENKRTVTVTLPAKSIMETSIFSKMFPGKTIVYKTDPNLIAGLKIVDNDKVFEFNLRGTLNDLTSHIKESYD